jgi:hypothetical protein
MMDMVKEGFKKIFGKDYIKVKLSLLWLFVMLNYIYADILTLMDSSALKEILAGTMGITPVMMFAGAILMEIPIAMVFLSLILRHKVNRWANIIAGVIKTLAVAGTMFVGAPAMYYSFFAVIEIIITVVIVVIAWRWKE